MIGRANGEAKLFEPMNYSLSTQQKKQQQQQQQL